MWFDEIHETVLSASPPEELVRYFLENRQRIEYTTAWAGRLGLTGKNVCEIGPGGIGLACKRSLGCEVRAFDCSEWFRPVCEKGGIPWGALDLHVDARPPGGPYDAVLLFEVIEHIARWPAEVFSELASALKPGGLLLVSTQNLVRTSNRIRMALGKRIFAHFVPEELLMGHLREYTLEELVFLLDKAGLERADAHLASFPDSAMPAAVRWGYSAWCRAFPSHSNFVFACGGKSRGDRN